MAFISDLHLFSSRSNAHEHEDAIFRAIRWCDLCVWGGDLFDFRWSRHPDSERTVQRALGWLERWCERFPQTQFVFLNGNHDAHAPFSQALAEWARGNERFVGGLDWLRVDDVLLVHGDVIEGDGSEEAFTRYRNRWSGKPLAGRLRNHAYDVAIAARMHRAVATATHRKKKTCLRLLRWMHRQPSEFVDGVRRIVFGHTHRFLPGEWVHGVQFFNGGAAIRHVPFAPVKLEFPTETEPAGRSG